MEFANFDKILNIIYNAFGFILKLERPVALHVIEFALSKDIFT